MRSLLMKSVLVGSCILLTAGAARASEAPILKANVPFPFLVNGKMLPAGQYVVEEEDSGPSAVVLIRGTHGPSASFVTTRPASDRGPNEPALRFERDGDQYRLSSIWEAPDEGQAIVIGHAK